MEAAGTLEAVCLRRVDLGEVDAVVTFLTREAGQLAALAKGVKQPRSRNAPCCALAAWSRIQLVHGRGSLPILGQTDLLDSFYALREDLFRSARASYLCDLTGRALPSDEPQPEVLDLLLGSLRGLVRAADGRALVHSFELRLLALLGWEPILDRCARTGEALGDEVLFCAAAGGLIRADERAPEERVVPVDPAVVRALRRLLSPDVYELDPAAVTVPSELVAPLREVTREHLRYHLELEPRSAEFLDRLDRLEPPG